MDRDAVRAASNTGRGHVGNRALGHASCDCSTGNGAGDYAHKPRIKRFRDQVVGTEGEMFTFICGGGFGAGRCTRKRCNTFDAGDFHFVVNFGRSDVEGTAKDEREAQYVVDLIGEITAACCDDRVGIGGTGDLWVDFRVGVGQCKNDRTGGHFLDHFRLENTRAG